MTLDELITWVEDVGDVIAKPAPDQLRLDGGHDRMLWLVPAIGRAALVPADLWRRAQAELKRRKSQQKALF